MSFFKKLFGGKKPSPAEMMDLPADSPAFRGEPIKAHDKFGRELTITRKDWFESVLKGNLEQAWDNPPELANLLLSAFNDGFMAALDAPTRRLCEIDPDRERGAVYRAVFCLQTENPAEAEQVLQEHIRQHGESGVVLTNLAKAQRALGRPAESETTLWRALEADPNQDNGLGWLMALEREKGGPAAEAAVLQRLAALPGSWRAQLWLARTALENRDLAAAQALYADALARASDPVPAELLQQMSGDLGNQGHLPELLELTLPRFDVGQHGLSVGNNLIKASIDTGQLEQARRLLRTLQQQQRPDWSQALNFWEGQLAEAKHGIMSGIDETQMKVIMVKIQGPLWLKPDSPVAACFAQPAEDRPGVVFLGSTFETAVPLKEVKVGNSDNPGRFSRALPLFLSETFYVNQLAWGAVGIPWMEHGGYVVSGQESDDDNLIGHARQLAGDAGVDFVVYSHLLTRGENWTVKIRLLRMIDGKRLAEFSTPFAETRFSEVADRILAELTQAFAAETAPVRSTPRPSIRAAELDHYLFRLEQCLAATCATMDTAGEGFLNNPADILNGMLHLCLQNPTHAESRLLLLRTVRAFKKVEPELLASFREKIAALMAEKPLNKPLQAVVQNELQEVWVAVKED